MQRRDHVQAEGSPSPCLHSHRPIMLKLMSKDILDPLDEQRILLLCSSNIFPRWRNIDLECYSSIFCTVEIVIDVLACDMWSVDRCIDCYLSFHPDKIEMCRC